METSQGYQPRLIGLSLGVILALLIWPATRWLVRSQLALSIPTPASVAPWSLSFGGIENIQAAREYAQRRSHETALRNPDDLLLQYAAALVVPPADGNLSADVKIQRLRELTGRFSDRPTLYAAILRFATLRQIRIERDEERQVTGDTAANTHRGVKEPYNTPEQLAAFDRDAAVGERLDPDNAYFPFLRSVGLFAAHRDAEALAALQRAAQKPAWTEYYNDEVEGEWKLQEETFGTVSALPRMAYAARLLFPHYSALRTASRVAIAKAIEAEQAGHIEDGLAIRDAVRHCGGLMRVHSTCLIGALVGISFSQISMTRPGGAPRIAPDTHGSASDRLREQRIRDYDSYLQRIGHAEKIAEVDAEAAAGVQARGIVKAGIPLSPFNIPTYLVISWIVGMVLLSSALWMLALGGAAALLARYRLIQTGQGLPSTVRPVIALGLLAAALSAGTGGHAKASLTSYLCLSGILLSGVLVLVLQESDRLRRMGTFAFSFGGAMLLCWAFAWQSGGSIGPIAQVLSLLGGSEGGAASPTGALLSALSIAIAAAIPLITLLTLCILSLLWRVPLSVGVVRGLRGCAIPIACVLLLAYGVLVPITLRQENTLKEGMKRTVQDEIHLVAELAGKEWPGPTH